MTVLFFSRVIKIVVAMFGICSLLNCTVTQPISTQSKSVFVNHDTSAYIFDTLYFAAVKPDTQSTGYSYRWSFSEPGKQDTITHTPEIAHAYTSFGVHKTIVTISKNGKAYLPDTLLVTILNNPALYSVSPSDTTITLFDTIAIKGSINLCAQSLVFSIDAAQSGNFVPLTNMTPVKFLFTQCNTYYPILSITDYAGATLFDTLKGIDARLYPQEPITDSASQNYRVVFPNGGETWYIGEQCTLKLWATIPGDANVNLLIGKNRFEIPGLGSKLTISSDSVFTFTMPDSLTAEISPGNAIKISAQTDAILIDVRSYDNRISDQSDCYFRVRKR